MKKLALGLITAISFASADFISASVGAGMWQENIDGYVKTGDDKNYFNKEDNNPKTGNLKLSDEVKPYVWAKIIHPIPLIPNVRAEYRQYHTTGKNGIAVGSVEIFGEKLTGAGTIDTDITIDSYDVTAFYELKLFFEVEAGIGVNVLDGTTEVVINGEKSIGNWTVPIPYLYGRVETPTLLGFSIEAQGKYVDVTDAFYHDYQGAIKYHLPIPIIDFTLSAGYKTQEIYGKDGDNETDMKFEGAYLELGARW
jgi:outer membrane protein